MIDQFEMTKTVPELAQKEVNTPLGSMKIILTTQEELNARNTKQLDFKPNHELLDRILTTGPFAKYLSTFGQDPNPITPRPGSNDSIPDPHLLPKIKPVKMEILHCLETHGMPFMGLAKLTYEQEQSNGAFQPVERLVFFRPDSGTSLVILDEKETGKKYIVLNRGMKDGVGAYFTGEASAGSLDGKYPDLLFLALKEVIEEIGLTPEEVKQGKIDEAFPALTASPGGTPERIAGFLVSIGLSSERIAMLKQHIGGADQHEVIQQILIEMPQSPTSFSQGEISHFRKQWEEILATTLDLKTHALLQKLRIKEMEKIEDYLISRLK